MKAFYLLQPLVTLLLLVIVNPGGSAALPMAPSRASLHSRWVHRWASTTRHCTSSVVGSPPQSRTAPTMSSPGGESTSEAAPLTSFQYMVAGAGSRTIAQALLHPVHVYKTLLQLQPTISQPLSWNRVFRGVDAQILFSLPHGAFHFLLLEYIRPRLSARLPPSLRCMADFLSSSASTFLCSAISTPQMVLTDRLMAGTYSSMSEAVRTIFQESGVAGYYAGWAPALAQKIPAYGLTWMLFQFLQRQYKRSWSAPAGQKMNFVLGAIAAAGSVAAMVPVDTVKTRLVVAPSSSYRGIIDGLAHISHQEGIGALYKSLVPRLVSVVPMMAIQVSVLLSPIQSSVHGLAHVC